MHSSNISPSNLTFSSPTMAPQTMGATNAKSFAIVLAIEYTVPEKFGVRSRALIKTAQNMPPLRPRVIAKMMTTTLLSLG